MTGGQHYNRSNCESFNPNDLAGDVAIPARQNVSATIIEPAVLFAADNAIGISISLIARVNTNSPGWIS